MTSPIIRIPGVRMRRLTIAEYLFSTGVQGAVYRPRDLSTLFLDYPPTAPVTAMEQQVATMLDISGNGNHAFQATAGKRPVVSRRVNLHDRTEQFSNAYWTKTTGVSVSPGAITSPTGGLADTLAYDGSGVTGSYRLFGGASIPPAGIGFTQYIRMRSVSGATAVRLDGNVSGGGSLVSNLTPDWQKFLVSGVSNGSSAVQLLIYSVAGNNATFTIGVWGASCTYTADAHLPYQWVNTATDYDDNAFKFPTYLKSDGIDDSYSSATGGGGNAGFFFSKAITVLGGAGTARTLFSDAGTNTGYIVRLNASNQLELAAGNGTAYTTIATAGTLAVGTTDVVQAWDDGVNLNVKIGTGPTASVARPAVAAGTAGYTMDQDNGASTGYFNGRALSCTVYTKNMAPTQVQREAVADFQRAEAFMP